MKRQFGTNKKRVFENKQMIYLFIKFNSIKVLVTLSSSVYVTALINDTNMDDKSGGASGRYWEH